MTDLNKYRGNPEALEAIEYYKNRYTHGDGVLLNQLESFDLLSGKSSKKYEPICPKKKEEYCKKTLKKKVYDYENDPAVSLEQILELVPKCFERFMKKSKELNFQTDKNIFIEIPQDKMIKIDVSNKKFDILDRSQFNDSKYVSYKLDFRLLYRILRGPKYAHWDNATVGSHIEFNRTPDVYEKKIYWCMNYFHF